MTESTDSSDSTPPVKEKKLGANELKEKISLETGKHYKLIFPTLRLSLEKIRFEEPGTDSTKFVLFSTDDESYKRSVTVSSDKIEKGDWFDLFFPGIREDLHYTLEVHPNGEEEDKYVSFENEPGRNFLEVPEEEEVEE
ncbi:MAG: hypothetical protein GY754_40500 [bacterium]|nr:hypothetical protein [bacterium]